MEEDETNNSSGGGGIPTTTWNLSAASRRMSSGDEEDDLERQRKSRQSTSRRKPLPPIDLMGISHSFTLPRSSSSSTHQHSSFSTVKPRHLKSPFHMEAIGESMTQQHLPAKKLSSSLPSIANSNSSGGGPGPMNASASWKENQQIPLATSAAAASPQSSSSRNFVTYNCCYCFQIQVEKNKSCTSTLLWLCVLLFLISVFSVGTVLVSHYYFGLFQLSRHEMRFLSRFYGEEPDLSSSSQAKPWLDAAWSRLPSSEELYVRAPPLVLPTKFLKTRRFLQAAREFALGENVGSGGLLSRVDSVVYPHGVDLVNAVGLFPAAKSLVLFGAAPVPQLSAVMECDSECLQLASELAFKAGLDLEQEGFVLPQTVQLARQDGARNLGVLPILLASVQAMEAQVEHMSELQFNGLRCIKLFITRPNAAAAADVAASTTTAEGVITAVYCGSLDEKSEAQRMFLRSLLKSQPAPLALLMRSSGYAFFANIKPDDTTMFNLHMKAMLMSLASIVVQDDSGIPFHLLKKHYNSITLYGRYRGPGDLALTGLQSQSGSAIKSLYQEDLADRHASGSGGSVGPLPFNFGYRVIIRPTSVGGAAAAAAVDKKQASSTTTTIATGVKGEEIVEHIEVFQKSSDFKGSHLIIARNERQ